MKNAVSIIIPTYNNIECIARVSSSVLKKTTFPFELIIVNNHSTKESVIKYLSDLEKRSEVQVINLPTNLYYFPAVNIGIRNADPNNRYVLILNDDVIIENTNWIQSMVDVLESDKQVAYVGDFIPRFGCPPFGGWVDGWCMLFKSKMLREIGLFDEEYVWWYSPADYAVRAYKRGYKFLDIKKPGDSLGRISGVITHIGGQTIGMVCEQEHIPHDRLYKPDFRYYSLLKKYGLYREYCVARSLDLFKRILTPFPFVKNMAKKLLNYQ